MLTVGKAGNHMDYRDYENNENNESIPNFVMVGEAYDTKEDAPANSYDPGMFHEPEKKKKKEPKYITRKAFVVSMIFCMILTSALTIGGYTLASQWGVGGTTKRISATNYTLEKATGSEKTIEEIVAMNENAVVEIRTESVSMDIWMQNYVTEGAGSGVIIDTKGYILTCNHVVEGASKITITLKDGTELNAKIVGTEPD
ncbi:MAG: trypsin-like peptidase domain-containing protein, partial [Firmicutes bacterium]|nr:trypsin-like peptidase domain-containing protein [Bacillota bacterium]